MDLGEEEKDNVLKGASCRYCQSETPGSPGHDLSTCSSCKKILDGSTCFRCLKPFSPPIGEASECSQCETK